LPRRFLRESPGTRSESTAAAARPEVPTGEHQILAFHRKSPKSTRPELPCERPGTSPEVLDPFHLLVGFRLLAPPAWTADVLPSSLRGSVTITGGAAGAVWTAPVVA
jgi:hypothetical protein